MKKKIFLNKNFKDNLCFFFSLFKCRNESSIKIGTIIVAVQKPKWF